MPITLEWHDEKNGILRNSFGEAVYLIYKCLDLNPPDKK